MCLLNLTAKSQVKSQYEYKTTTKANTRTQQTDMKKAKSTNNLKVNIHYKSAHQFINCINSGRGISSRRTKTGGAAEHTEFMHITSRSITLTIQFNQF
jgi:hypothetical protein